MNYVQIANRAIHGKLTHGCFEQAALHNKGISYSEVTQTPLAILPKIPSV